MSESSTLSPLARVACWGLLSRRERWGLSLRGWVMLMAGLLLALPLALLGAYPFLAITDRTPAEYLAVEGWVHDYAIHTTIEEFTAGRYQKVFTTGGPVKGAEALHLDSSTAAGIGARRLRDFGLPADCVQMVPARSSARDRTFGSALALRDWLRARHIAIRHLNVVTEDVHARRTRLLFQTAFGDTVTVGVIAVPTTDYDAAHWWRYSAGVRDVIGEVIAYLYAKFLFFPPAAPAGETALSSPS